MKAQFKIDFETFMMANQNKYDMYFENMTYTNDHDLVYIKYIPLTTRRPTIDLEQHEVLVRFHCFSSNVLPLDRMVDDLSALLSEKSINSMEFGTVSSSQRGNKFGDVYETIAEVKFYHWGAPPVSVTSLS